MPRHVFLATLAVTAVAVLPSTASAAAGGTSDAAKACVTSSAPGIERGKCVSEAARNVYSGTIQVTWYGLNWDDSPLVTLTATGLKPNTLYYYATTSATTGERLGEIYGLWTDAAGAYSSITFARGCTTGTVVNLILDDNHSAIWEPNTYSPAYKVPFTCGS